jgi:hypothetical protein
MKSIKSALFLALALLGSVYSMKAQVENMVLNPGFEDFELYLYGSKS